MTLRSRLWFLFLFFIGFLLLAFFSGCQKEAGDTLSNPVDSLPDKISRQINKILVTKMDANNRAYRKTTYTIDAKSNMDSFIVYSADTMDYQNACYGVTITKVAHYYYSGLLSSVKSRTKTKTDCGINPGYEPFKPTFGNYDIEIRYHPQYQYPSQITFSRYNDTLGNVLAAKKIYALSSVGPFTPKGAGFQLYSNETNVSVDFQKVTNDTLLSFQFGVNDFYDWLVAYNKQNVYESFDNSYHFFNYNKQQQIESYVGVNLWDSFYSPGSNLPGGGEYRPQLERKLNFQYNNGFDSVVKLLGIADFHQYVPFMRIFDDEFGFMVPKEATSIDLLLQQCYSCTDSLLYVRHGKRDLIGTVKYNSISKLDEKGRLKTVVKTNSRTPATVQYDVFYAE